MAKRRVVVTGLGMLSPLGNSVDQSWSAILDGKSGIATIDSFDVSNFNTRIGGAVKNFAVDQYMSAKEAKRFDPFIHYGIAAAEQALADAGLPVMDSTTHIVPLMVGDPVHAKKISDILLAEYGVYVQPINFPTVPRGTERLRFTPGPAHTAEMMDDLVGALVEIWDRMDMELAKAA